MTTMDLKKMNIPTLDGPNWGVYSIHLQAVALILDCWDVIKGEILGTTPQTYDILNSPTTGPQGMHPDPVSVLPQILPGKRRTPRH